MDLIKKIETTEFSQRLRGYDIDEVDAFHAELVRDIAQLNRQAADIDQRGSGGSGQSAPATRPQPDRSSTDGRLYDPEGAIQRMLAVAQRTADEALSEARDEASRMVAEAEAQAARLTTEAEARLESVNSEADQQRRLIVTEAAAEARRIAEATREPLVTEIAALERRRDALLADLTVLETHVEDERTRLGATLARLKEVLDDPIEFRTAEHPELTAPATVSGDDVSDPSDSGDTSTEFVESDDESWDGAIDEPDDLVDFDDPEPAPATEISPAGALDRPEEADDAGDGSSVGQLFDEEPEASVTDLQSVRNEVLRVADAPLPAPEPVRSPYPDETPTAPARSEWDDPTDTDGPPTESVFIDDLLGGADSNDNDRFLDELRRATENEFGADESDAAIAAFFDQDEDRSDKRRGRRS